MCKDKELKNLKRRVKRIESKLGIKYNNDENPYDLNIKY